LIWKDFLCSFLCCNKFIGHPEHVSDLITRREIGKLARKIVNEGIKRRPVDLTTVSLTALEADKDHLSKFYMGEGVAVPL